MHLSFIKFDKTSLRDKIPHEPGTSKVDLRDKSIEVSNYYVELLQGMEEEIKPS